MRITMVGTGYVGLVSGTCFAEFGALVTCVDVDTAKIAALRQGQIPIFEPGLQEMVAANVAAGRLHFTSDYPEAIGGADLVFIAVGTPSRRGDGHADLRYVFEAARQIAPHLAGYTVVVDKSTVPVGTARNVARLLREHAPEADFDIASNPEFLREGEAIADFIHPDRVVLGLESPRAEALLREAYRPIAEAGHHLLITGIESAELIKYAANAFLATKVSFINEISALSEAVGANIEDIANGLGLDRRIGSAFLRAGPGYGGSCFPKDTLALARIAQERGLSCRIVEATIEANAAHKARMIDKIRKTLGGEAGKTLAVLGLTFKPNTDDMRDAPALAILPALVEGGARIQAHDPEGMDEARRLLPEAIHYCASPKEALAGADAAILLTEWPIYRHLHPDEVREGMRGRIFLDLRNAYPRAPWEAAGFVYVGVGR